jgi:hypothetical protein
VLPSGVSWCCSSPHAHRALITMSAFFPPAPASCQRRTSAQPRVLSRYSATCPAGSAAARRRVRVSALRRWARFKHARLGCRYAPLPGSRAVMSGTISPPATTKRINSGLAARTPQPTHVRIGSAGRPDCSRRFGRAGSLRLALVPFSLPRRPRVPLPPQVQTPRPGRRLVRRRPALPMRRPGRSWLYPA